MQIKINLKATQTYPNGMEFNLNKNEIQYPVSQPLGTYKPEPIIVEINTSTKNESLLLLAEKNRPAKDKLVAKDQIELLVSDENVPIYKFKNGFITDMSFSGNKFVFTFESMESF